MSNIDFLRVATNARRRAAGQEDLDPLEFYAFVMPKVRLQAPFVVPMARLRCPCQGMRGSTPLVMPKVRA